VQGFNFRTDQSKSVGNIYYRNLGKQPANREKTKNFSTNYAIITPMKKSILSQTNPYLRDKTKRLSGLVVSVCSSSAIEGIEAKAFIKEYLEKKDKQPTRRKSGANKQ
jgi:hypothetical protein